MEGQEVFVNKNSKVVIIKLYHVFEKAGIKFKWKDELGWRAFGINKSVLRLVEMTKSKLLVDFYSKKTKKQYWISHDVLRSFVENNDCGYRVAKNNLIYNIPLALFKSKPVFSDVK